MKAVEKAIARISKADDPLDLCQILQEEAGRIMIGKLDTKKFVELNLYSILDGYDWSYGDFSYGGPYLGIMLKGDTYEERLSERMRFDSVIFNYILVPHESIGDV